MNTRKPRTYTYRIPLDDTAAMTRLRRFERSHDSYHIYQAKRKDIPNRNAAKHIGVVFYHSKETRGKQRGDFEGGAIPEMAEYRHSLEWEPTPETELLEMKRGSDGGTDIRGEQFMGTHDPRLSDYVPVETTVPWTPSEIEMMFNGKDVQNKVDYSHDPPMMDAELARAEYRRLIELAMDDGFEKMREELNEMEEECDHDHAIETRQGGYCEDCGRDWWDEQEMEADEVTIVGTA